MNPQSYCENICKQSGSNFLYAALFLKPEQRQALHAFYAFCTTVDDAVDSPDSKDRAREYLAFWRLELDRMYVSEPEHQIGLALAPVLKSYGVPKTYLEEIINGCAMDLEKSTYANLSELELYCYRVASCVGLVCLYFFGIAATEQNQKAAIALGKALQITNILRDIKEDAERGRVYLPKGDTNLETYIAIARDYFQKAKSLLPVDRPEKRKWFPALLMGGAYEALLNEIAKDPSKVYEWRIAISKLKKMWITLRTFLSL
ncbi:MAG: squalene/phytoene synthase family protein [Deltaproteobacteria bacterium]|nr:squalene/phytoene synthase family protein [Deltaproteobacteria bacterium]